MNIEQGVGHFCIVLKFVFELKELRVGQLQNLEIKFNETNSRTLHHLSSKSKLFNRV